jgi:restriction system protein
MEGRTREEKINMTKKDKKQLFGLLNGLTYLIGFYIWYKLSLDIIAFYIILFSPPIISFLIVRMIPVKQKKNKSVSKKSIRNNQEPTSKLQKKKLNDKEILSTNIDDLSGIDFERLCFMYFEAKGFKPETTKISGDHGVDLVIKDPKDGMKIAVQCKRWKKDNSVGNADLIKLFAGSRAYKCMGTLFITTSTYTYAAKDYAESVKMDLWSRLTVLDRIGTWQKEKLKKIG